MLLFSVALNITGVRAFDARGDLKKTIVSPSKALKKQLSRPAQKPQATSGKRSAVN